MWLSWATLALPVAPAPLQSSPGVDIPVFPLLASLAGLVALAIVSLGALRMPRLRRRAPAPRKDRAPPRPLSKPPAPVAPPPAVVYKKAPVGIEFPQIKPRFPDVWGVDEPVEIALRLSDGGLVGQKTIPGFRLTVDGEPIQAVFLRGQTALRRTFARKGEKEIVAELKVKNESSPRRTTRHLKIVDYREEIADVFENFKQEASRTITPLREDATAWEIYDLLTDANAKLPRQVVRDIVSCFEEAKFSNHPVTRATYERMIQALLHLEGAVR